MNPFFSICIPSYNRVEFLNELLISIVKQKYDGYEIIIAEDKSPQRDKIRAVVSGFMVEHNISDIRLRYVENEVNFGYDGNIRNLVSLSKGRYCFFMGNDDVMSDGALELVHERLSQYKNIGLVLRSYGWFDNSGPEHVVRYGNSDRLFKPGTESIVFSFRRVGVIAGFIVDARLAKDCATEAYDGTLYYQMHLAYNALINASALYVDTPIVMCRNNIPPDFGNSVAEKGMYTPGEYTLKARIAMISGMLRIAKEQDLIHGMLNYDLIKMDISKYSFPILAKERGRGLSEFTKFSLNLAQIGIGSTLLFWGYFMIILLLGKIRAEKLFFSLKNRIGYTPQL